MAVPRVWPSCRAADEMLDATAACASGKPPMMVVVIAGLHRPAPTPSRPYARVKDPAGVVSRYRAMAGLPKARVRDPEWAVPRYRAMAEQPRARIAPPASSGTRPPGRAANLPASGAHTVIAAGMGSMAKPARSGLSPRASCRYKVVRNRKPATVAVKQIAAAV